MKKLAAVLALAAAGAACSTAPKMTESEEYYIGRSVAAEVVARHPYVEDESLQDYVNQVGYTIALASDRPVLYGGYHFAVVESDEINAFAAPGGFVFVTTGALKAMSSEEEMAGVLAHEIAHVVLRHPDSAAQAAKNRRATSQVLGFLSTIAQQSGEGNAAEVAQTLEEVTNDVILDLLEKGYSRDQEYAADELGLKLLQSADVGYDPFGLREFVSRLPRVETGFSWGGSTHPAPADRVRRMDGQLLGVPRARAVDSAEFLRFRARAER